MKELGPMAVAEAIAGTLLVIFGIASLNLSWRRRRASKVHLRIGGWLPILSGFILYSRVWGAEVGIAYAFAALALVAYAVIAVGIEFRNAPARAARELALEPEERVTNWARGIAKSLLAIALAGIASIGVGVAIAVSLPMAPYDRIMFGGVLVPVLWGGGMAWTLSDAKLLRATIVLVSVSVVSYGIAFLPKVLS
jgi:hypothetical protein